MEIVTVVTVVKNLFASGRVNSFIECLKSVTNQDYKNIEHIVIDGGSNDGTVELLRIIDSIKFISKEDNGIYEAMNRGIEISSGSYLIFLNSDDKFCRNDAISLLVKGITLKGTDFVYASANMKEHDKLKWIFDDNILQFWNRMPFCHQTMLTKKELFNKVGKFNEKLKLASDYEFILRAVLSGATFYFVDRVIVDFSLDGSTLKQIKLSRKEMEQIYFKYYSAFFDFNKNKYKPEKIVLNKEVNLKFIINLYLYLKKNKNIDLNAIKKVIRSNIGVKFKIFKFFKFNVLYKIKCANESIICFINGFELFSLRKKNKVKTIKLMNFNLIETRYLEL